MPQGRIFSPIFSSSFGLQEVLVTGSLMPSDTCLYSRAGNNIRLECSVSPCMDFYDYLASHPGFPTYSSHIYQAIPSRI